MTTNILNAVTVYMHVCCRSHEDHRSLFLWGTRAWEGNEANNIIFISLGTQWQGADSGQVPVDEGSDLGEIAKVGTHNIKPKLLVGREEDIEVDRRTCLWSHHFDPSDINQNGFAEEDPKSFAWNNLGQLLRPKNRNKMREDPVLYCVPDPSLPEPTLLMWLGRW